MIDYKPLKTKKIYRETTEWVSDSVGLMYEKPMEIFHSFLNNEDLPAGYGTLSGACLSLAAWYEELFIVASFEEDLSAKNYLAESLSYDSASLLIQDKIRDACPDRHFMDYSFRKHGLILAKAAAAGNFAEFDWLGNFILKNFKSDNYAGLSSTKAAWFTLNLFCLWKGDEPFTNESMASLPDCYRILLNEWNSELSNHFGKAFEEACELHIDESKYDTNKRYYDFNDHFYRVFPAELLSVIQLRKKLNITIPHIEHPLFQLPTIILLDASENSQNEILKKVRQKVMAELL